MTDESVLADFRSCLAEKLSGTSVDVAIQTSGEPAETPAESRVVTIASEAYERHFGQTPELRGMVAASDGWWFANRFGIPTLMAFGPGRIADCHVVDESVDIDELHVYAAIYEDVVRSFLR